MTGITNSITWSAQKNASQFDNSFSFWLFFSVSIPTNNIGICKGIIRNSPIAEKFINIIGLIFGLLSLLYTIAL
jgi:uncharacterized protein with PQ loop repeat